MSKPPLSNNTKVKSIFLPVTKIDVRFATKKFLNKSKATEKEKYIFLKDCQHFLKATVLKLIKRGGLKYEIVKGISCLDPSIIQTKLNVAESRMNIVLETFYSKILSILE